MSTKKIKTWLLRGDCHGDFTWLYRMKEDEVYDPDTTAIIILGDASINFWLDKRDIRLKKEISQFGFTLYCVRGNHEARPQDLENINSMHDDNVHGIVYVEDEFPLIRYFLDYSSYRINGYRCLVIGGAYSVDKYYRLLRAGIIDKKDPRYYNPKVTHWFYNEQLNTEEMNRAMWFYGGKRYDFVFTHTCPYSWRPTDLFLNAVDQSSVDNSMELWMDDLKDSITFHAWCFGHFHADRLERPHVEMYYRDIESLNDIAERWTRYDETGELDWWLQRSPHFDEV